MAVARFVENQLAETAVSRDHALWSEETNWLLIFLCVVVAEVGCANDASDGT